MTAIMIRSNRIMHDRCHDNDAAKRGQIAVTQFQAGDWRPPEPTIGKIDRNRDWLSSFLMFSVFDTLLLASR